MKKTLLSVLLLAGYCSYAQFTTIPDANFENRLIELGIDSGAPDGKVLTSAAAAVTDIDLSFQGISDLTGIQAFTSLINLDCFKNNLSTVDLSQNTALSYIQLGQNLFTSIDLSNRPALTELGAYGNLLTSVNVSGCTALLTLTVDENQLTSLDISTNMALESLIVDGNKLTSLDISNYTNMVRLSCRDNQLTSLNVKNGMNDTWMPFVPFFTGNPNLTCIQVDDATYADESWVGMADPTAAYSTDCSTLSTEDQVFDKIALYPNPVNSELHINNLMLNKATVYNALGQLVKTVNYTTAVSNNVIDLSGLPKGIYYLYMESGTSNAARKIVVE